MEKSFPQAQLRGRCTRCPSFSTTLSLPGAMVQHLVRLRARPRDQAEFGPADSTLGASRKRSCPGSILVQYVIVRTTFTTFSNRHSM